MKKEGSLKSILAILVIILVCLVSLGGIYVKDKNVMKNWLPDYVLGAGLQDSTIIKLDVNKPDETSSENTTEENLNTEDSDTNETVNENENLSDETQNEENVENTENSTEAKESETNSSEENKSDNGQAPNIYTLDNYKKSKKIIEKRLKLAGVTQFETRLDEKSGSIIVEVPEDIDSSILQSVFETGKTEIKITETNEVIGDQNSIKKFETAIDDTYVSYGAGSNVKINVEFSKDAINKFKEMKNNYVIPTDESGAQKENNIEITIDGSAIVSLTESEFLESAVKGTLQLYGNYTTDAKTLNQSLNAINSRKMLIETENLPIEYTINYQSKDIHSTVNKYGIISVFAVILVAMLIYLVYKFKLNGLLAELCILGFGALALLIIRITKVQISIATISALIGILILQFIYLIKLLDDKKISSKVFNEKTVEFTKILVPLFIFGICSAVVPAFKNSVIVPFGSIQELSNFGMVAFWGLFTFELFNNILTRAIFTKAKNK